MDTKLKKFRYGTFIKTMAWLLLSVMIFTVSTVAFYARGYGSFLFSSNYYETREFYENITEMTGYINQRGSDQLERYAPSLQYTAYDDAGKIVTAYSNGRIDEKTFKKTDCVLVYTYTSEKELFALDVPSNTKMWDIYKIQHLLRSYNFTFATQENEAKLPYHRIVLKFDYQQDIGILGNTYKSFVNFKETQDKVMVAGVIALLAGLFIAIYLIVVTGKTHSKSEVKLNFIDRIPLEVVALIMASLYVVMMKIAGDYIFDLDKYYRNYSLPYSLNLWQRLFDYRIFFVSLLSTVILVMGYALILSLIRSLKARKFLKRILSLQLIINFLKLFSIKRLGKAYKPILALYLLTYGVLNILFGWMMFVSQPVFGLICFVLFNGFAVHWLLKQLKSLKQVIDYTDDVVNKGINESLDTSTLVPFFQPFSDNINRLKDGLSVAIDNAVKNERMRTELITNVTHDLKNPLTSIISYADLLSKENLENDNAKQYVSIISEKSNRLKDLIDHLVDASKLSSGVSSVNLDKVDLVALSKQLQGEYHEDFAEKELEYVIQTKLESALIVTDVKHYTRILDNLFSNVIKYALAGTRVYYTIEETEDSYQMCIKNISNHPLEISAEDLTERFVRGDTARSSEGNGLGLSIAKSLAASLDIALDFYIDGDLFKACLVHKKAEIEES